MISCTAVFVSPYVFSLWNLKKKKAYFCRIIFAYKLIEAQDAVLRGAGEILLTSMETDGVKTGFDLEITAAISDNVLIMFQLLFIP